MSFFENKLFNGLSFFFFYAVISFYSRKLDTKFFSEVYFLTYYEPKVSLKIVSSGLFTSSDGTVKGSTASSTNFGTNLFEIAGGYENFAFLLLNLPNCGELSVEESGLSKISSGRFKGVLRLLAFESIPDSTDGEPKLLSYFSICIF